MAMQTNWESVRCLLALNICISFFRHKEHMADQIYQKTFLEHLMLWLIWMDGKAECDSVCSLETHLDMEEISTTAQMTGLSPYLTPAVQSVFRYKDKDPHSLTSAIVMEKLKARDIHLMFCRITNRTDKMITEFARHYDNDCGFELVAQDIFGSDQVAVCSS